MNYIRTYQILVILLLGTFVSCDVFDNNTGIPKNEDIWINAYLVSWQHNPQTEQINSGILLTRDIDWDSMTHMTYFALSIAPDGTPELSLDPVFRHNFNSDRLIDIVSAAHANDTKIVFSVGGSTNYDGFSTAIDSSRSQFIETISNIITTYGFDGVSLNMTPIEPEDYAHYRTFVRQLSSTFDTLRTTNNERPLLMAGVTNASGMSSLFSSLQKHFNQINILTYEMSRPWRGWITWHQTPLYNRSNLTLENTSQSLPSINLRVVEWVKSGVDRSKIGFTISFYGSVWQHLHIQEKWDGWPTENQSLYKVIPYSNLSESYDLEAYQWDDQAQAAFIQLDDPKSFISFDNEQSITAKIEFIKSNRLGGVMIWDLSAGHNRNNIPANPLLDTIKPHVRKHPTESLAH